MNIIAIEGNIGVGKSTLIEKLAPEMDYQFIKEPIDQDPEADRLLELMYNNPTIVNRLNFQNYLTTTRSELLNSLPDGNYMIERSLFSDVIFTQMDALNYVFNEGDYETAMKFYGHLANKLHDYPKIGQVLYLKADPLTCLKRVQQRGRPQERDMGLNYLVNVHNFHEAVLPKLCEVTGTKLTTVNANMLPTRDKIAETLNGKLNAFGVR